MSFDHGIRYELDGHAARVTIDRPHVLNAVDRAAHVELQRVWADIEASSDVRVVVLTGAGDRSFCVGADVSAAGVDKTGMEYWADLDPDGFGGLSLRESLDVPVIARVNGYALGGGMRWCSAATSSWPPRRRGSGSPSRGSGGSRWTAAW